MVKENTMKQTELGLLPEDWEMKKLNNIGVFSKGKGISKTEANSGSIPAIRYGELYTKHHSVIRKFYSFINSQVASNSIKLKKGDILFAGSGETKEEIGKSVAFIDDEEAFVGGDIVILSLNKSCEPTFLGYLLNSKEIQKQKSANGQGDAVVHIYSSSLRDVKIPLPPLPEQEAIAEALSDADAWIESLEQLIAKKRLIKQGAMQELLRAKSGWELKKLGEIGEIITGGTPSTLIARYWNGDIPWITPTDINIRKDISLGERGLTTLGISQIRKLRKNSLLVTCIASIGKNAILRVDGACNQQINAITPNPLFDVEYLYYLLELNKKILIGKAGTTATLMLSKAEFSLIEFKFPSLTEQTRIATILSDMDAALEALEAQLDKARQIKQGMMQELLTGRTRLT